MATPPSDILLIDSDSERLARMRLDLESADYRVRTAGDGLQGLAAIMMRAPMLIVAGLVMPKMDGIGLVRAVRSNERMRHLPIVLVGERSDSDLAARARAAGANIVLARPMPREVLLLALAEELRDHSKLAATTLTGLTLSGNTQASLPVIEPERLPNPMTRTDPRSPARDLPSPKPGPKLEQHTLPANFAQFIDQAPETLINESILNPDFDLAASQMITKRNTTGTVLFSDIRNFTSMSEKLESEQVVELLNAYFARACEPIQRQHGWVVKFLGDGLVALFESPPDQMQDHAERALKAGLLMILAATRFRTWISDRHPGKQLPEFCIGVGIHTGDVTVCKMGSHDTVETTIIGDTVNTAARLEEATKELQWSVVASQPAFDGAGPRLRGGRRSQVSLKGRVQPVDIVEVVGLDPKQRASEQERRFYEAVSAAVQTNSDIIRRWPSRRATGASPASGNGSGVGPDGQPDIPGYRLLRKLGEGGMSLVYLAERESDAGEVVLKLLPINDKTLGETLQRFIQEYSTISQVDHPSVARIFEQGFTQRFAYIAMEHFPGGDLRGIIKSGMTAEMAQSTLIRIAGALAAIHKLGIVHRDMKPDNVMLRRDGSLVLADFGIAKHLENALMKTRHGEVYGTPYYISPEQAVGGAVDTRSDLYSLGVMLFEMLTGKKPYYADNAQGLLYQHVHSPIPRLPATLARFQPLLDQLMAKKSAERFSSAAQVIEAAMQI
ncbi:protein kinase domain-containing protein [Derxia gummosa]|uniref:Protein kinase domain-containing protein n=1 Tax=Derxia gummosa DSM 723 TaxID=1121388 RepID=A0A8B6X205_9BURK|nr:protein kinase [Derxia gummosa]